MRYLVLIFSIFVSIELFFSVAHPGYGALFVLPLLYGITFFIFLYPILKNSAKIFEITFVFVAGVRYLLLPWLIQYVGYYNYGRGTTPWPSSIETAIFLMAYELLFSSAVFYFVFSNIKYKDKVISHGYSSRRSILLAPKSTAIYLLFVMAVGILIIISPDVLSEVSVILPNEDISRNVYGKGSFLHDFTIYSITVAKQIIFLLLICVLSSRYRKNAHSMYIVFALLLTFINSFVYYNSGRLDILITTTVSVLIMAGMFEIKRVVPLLVFFTAMLIAIIVAISVVRETKFISKSNSVMVDVADMFNVYVAGPYNVAMAVETAERYPESRGLSVLLFDIFRPMLGVNVFLKDSQIQLSNYYFNYRIFGGSNISQIIPMVGQGYLFFGYIGAPIFTVLFIVLAGALSRYINRVGRVELVYFVSAVLVRLGFVMAQGTTNIVNYLSVHLFLFVIVYYINNKVKSNYLK